jgi:hypothetical protein
MISAFAVLKKIVWRSSIFSLVTLMSLYLRGQPSPPGGPGSLGHLSMASG